MILRVNNKTYVINPHGEVALLGGEVIDRYPGAEAAIKALTNQ